MTYGFLYKGLQELILVHLYYLRFTLVDKHENSVEAFLQGTRINVHKILLEGASVLSKYLIIWRRGAFELVCKVSICLGSYLPVFAD
jgi:hypothetical protein